MEYSERVLCATGELELDPNIVSEEAGKLYSELQTVIEAHGEGVVESLVPIFVWVLEVLASCKAQLREREDEAASERAEREGLLERYQAEKVQRKECQERFLELDDQIEQERRAMRGREKERESREKRLEKKAREQADQLVALEEQKSALGRELSTLRLTHNKMAHSYRELLEKRKDSERYSPLRNRSLSKNAEVTPKEVLSDTNAQNLHSNSGALPLEDVKTKEDKVMDIIKAASDQFVNDIISSTPELRGFHSSWDDASAPARPSTETSDTSLEDELKKDESEEENGGGPQEPPKEKEGNEHEDEDLEEDGLEWELRNTDSVFSELSELSQDFVESVDQGASVRGSADQFEKILAEYEELKNTHEMVEAARKALISRVMELTDDRSTLKLEVASLRETVSRVDSRIKEREEEMRRLREELEEHQSADSPSSLSTSMRHFTRSEMARVVMEKNQYKQRLFELQEAMTQSQTLRATKEERLSEERRSSLWSKFNRFFGLSKQPLILPRTTLPSVHLPPVPLSQQRQEVNCSQAELSAAAVASPRARRREIYREIRSHVWGTLGKRQLHGWSVPLANTQESQESVQEPQDVPVLMQLRLLDQRDSTAKLNCAVAVPPDISGEATCSVWVVSGPASNSSVSVIDPARSNTVLDQFSLPPTAPALCICAVPPVGDSPGTVWIGTQEGSIVIHSASGDRGLCLHSVSLSESVHSLKYTKGHVIAGLGDGTLAFFSSTSGGWNLHSHSLMPLGSNPVQPIRCCLAKGGRMWVGYWNKVHVIDINRRKVEHVFPVSERSEQQVRFLCAEGNGVWTSCRLDSVLRLFDWATWRLLQEVDFSALVTKSLGPAFLTLSPLQITSLAVISSRLWVGMAGGAIISIPLSITSEAISIPYCSPASAQLCYHGHRQAVRFIIAAPGCLMATAGKEKFTSSQLILSGGEGYINFRIGDDEGDGSLELCQATPQRFERSHMIIWQN
ncbi:C-Jun-amino-terminal kinase-interacting protein 4 [Stigmatopora nigra]